MKRSESLWLKLDAHDSMFMQEPSALRHIQIRRRKILVFINGS
jgi:hypothetical protein